MIFSSIKNLSENNFGQKYMACAAEFLKTHNLDELPLGKTEIDGDNVFINVMEFEPALPSEKDYEAHKVYADIHVVISGTESIAVAPQSPPVARTTDEARTSWVFPPSKHSWKPMLKPLL